MKKRLLLLCLTLGLTGSLFSQEIIDIKISSKSASIVDSIELNSYRAVKEIYTQLIGGFEFLLGFSYSDDFTIERKYEVIEKTIRELSRARNIEMKYLLSNGKEIKIDLLHGYSKKKHLNIFFISNYNYKTKKILSSRMTKQDRYQRYGTQWVLIDGDLINAYDLYRENKEKEIIDSGSKNNLADYYLFDGNRENDYKIENLLKEDIVEMKKNQNFSGQIVSTGTLIEYFCSIYDYEKIFNTYELFKSLIDAQNDEFLREKNLKTFQRINFEILYSLFKYEKKEDLIDRL